MVKPFPRSSNQPKFLILQFSRLFALVAIFSLSNCAVGTQITGTATGNISPEITAINNEGVQLSLSDLHGSYVLIEFWESGNSSARTNHFEMQRLFKKYEKANFEDGKGFCIYSVSLDSDKSKWLEAIKKDNITWPCQVIDTKAWNAAAAIAYGVGFVPQYYLIDGRGVIVKKNILIQDLEEILTKKLDGRQAS